MRKRSPDPRQFPLPLPAVRPRGSVLRRLSEQLKLSDETIAAIHGVTPLSIAKTRAAHGIRNHLGWPIADDLLRELVAQLPDAEIARRYGVGPRTVEQARVRLGIYRPTQPCRGLRASVGCKVLEPRTVMPIPMTPWERAKAKLNGRLREIAGCYWLDGRPCKVWDVFRAAGIEPEMA